MPTFGETIPNQVHQADILYLPNDDGYKFALVVCDDATRITDAVPLKTKSNEEVLKAFKTIYARKIIKLPKKMEVDPGSEFKGSVAKWFEDQNIIVRVGKVGRHRQQAIVERRNQIIGTAIHKRQAAEELLTGEPATAWVDDLPKLITAMNKRTKKQHLERKAEKYPDEPVCEKGSDSCNLLKKGTKVRVMLETPKSVQGEKLSGKFRSSDIRWDQTERTINQILLKPGEPCLYLLDGNSGPDKVDLTAAYTKRQLQVIDPKEEYPEHTVIKHPENVKHFRIKKILDKKKIKNRWMVKVWWLGYPQEEATWEPLKTIKEDQPKLISEFEKNQG